jgi:hypothetical protein
MPARRYARNSLAATAALIAAAALSVAGASAAAAPAPKPAGDLLSRVHWSYTTPAPGVTVGTGTLSDPAAAGHWTVTVTDPVTSRLTGAPAQAEAGPPGWAASTAASLRADGWAPQVQAIRWPGYADTPHGVMGYRVRVGDFAAQSGAQGQAAALQAQGFPATAEWTGFDAGQAPDAESFHVAVIDPARFRGVIQASHGAAIAQRQTTSSLARQAGAVVATNGGFFATADSAGFQGDPSGAAVYGGRLEGMAAGDRAALLLAGQGRQPSIVNASTDVTVTDGKASAAVQGVDRKPGIVQDCGRPNAVPTTAPRQDLTCTATSDLVLFDSRLGTAAPSGPGSQAVLDGTGRVVAEGARGGNVPAGGLILQGTGQDADWLAAHATPGSRLRISETVRDAATGRRIPLTAADSLVSAAPVLVRGGRVDIDAATEGVVDPADLSFGYAWADQRQPRTMAGITAGGKLILAIVDGRQPGVSEGLTLAEEADFMRGLGAVDAMNLDGGGSTAMAVNGALVNRPSDATGERADGDVILVRR